MHEIGAEVVGRILDHHAEIFEMERITQRRFTQTLLAIPTKTMVLIPRERKTLSSCELKKALYRVL
jgi:hypothetical protein